MLIIIIICLIAALLFFGMKTIFTAWATKDYSYIGRRALTRMQKWRIKKADIWTVFPLKQLLSFISHVVYVNDTQVLNLSRSLSNAGLTITPKEFIARKYIIIASGFCVMAISYFLNFYIGLFIGGLVTVYALMKQRDALNTKIKKKERMIIDEMPRFVRSVCRSLESDRDLYNVIVSYRKVAGPELGGELDVLLAEMSTGNVQKALVHFDYRLGTSEASRLCGALRDMSMGIDQTVTLNYIADDMARRAKENIRKELSLRPGKMRRTYYPAIAICIAMIMYVLVVYVINNLNNLY